MNVQVEVGGTRRSIVLHRAGRGWLVDIDGRQLYADIAAANGRWSLLIAEAAGAGPAEAGPYAGLADLADAGPAVGDLGSGSSQTGNAASGSSQTGNAASGSSQTGIAVSGFSQTGNAASGFSPTSRSYEVAADDRAIFVNGHAVPVVIDDPRAPRSRRGRQMGSGAMGSGRVLAPMPGRIVKILVAAGDAVIAGQSLLVMEAMKMENEIRASKAGTVVDVRVAEGASVDAHTVLMHLE